VNLVLCTVLQPYLLKKFNQNLVEGDVTYALNQILCYVLLGIVISYQKSFKLEPMARRFRISAHSYLEKIINQKILLLNFNQIRSIHKQDLNRIKNDMICPMLYFIMIIVKDSINLLPFIGYFVLLFMMSPLSGILYVISMLVVIYFVIIEDKPRDIYNKLWDKYNFLVSNSFYDIIHGRGEINCKSIEKIVSEIEQARENGTIEHSKYFGKMEMVFHIIFAINILIFTNDHVDISDVLIFFPL